MKRSVKSGGRDFILNDALGSPFFLTALYCKYRYLLMPIFGHLR
jgi:hypothetical protein